MTMHLIVIQGPDQGRSFPLVLSLTLWCGSDSFANERLGRSCFRSTRALCSLEDG